MFSLFGMSLSTVIYLDYKYHNLELKYLKRYLPVKRVCEGKIFLENACIYSEDGKSIYKRSKFFSKPLYPKGTAIEFLRSYEINDTLVHVSDSKKYKVRIGDKNLLERLDMSCERSNEKVVQDGYESARDENGNIRVVYKNAITFIEKGHLPSKICCNIQALVRGDEIYVVGFPSNGYEIRKKYMEDRATCSKRLFYGSLVLLSALIAKDSCDYCNRNN